MKWVIFGLTLSSSWGNGHATLWRGLVRALARAGHAITFFERDVDYYALHRDLSAIEGVELVLYRSWDEVRRAARNEVRESDVAILTSYCPDAQAAADLSFDSAGGALNLFYDLDTPVTLARLSAGERVSYLPERGLGDFDLVLSFTGGRALRELHDRLGARRVAPLYGHADSQTHFPVEPTLPMADLSYLGTYAPDRQQALETLFLEPASRHPDKRFAIGGSGYPHDFPWRENIWFRRHVAPPDHPRFFSSSRLTLNVTRADMARMGCCPSGRLFEAAACGTLVLSDSWEGLDSFYTPGEQILVAHDSHDASAALDLSPAELARLSRNARERTLDEHTSTHRARELIRLVEERCAEPSTVAPPLPEPRSMPLHSAQPEG